MDKVEQLEQRVAELENMLRLMVFSDRYAFQRDIQMFDGKDVQLGLTTGTMIGTGATQKLGFFGKTPVVQQSAITAPSGGATIDSQSRAAINSLINVLQALGLTA